MDRKVYLQAVLIKGSAALTQILDSFMFAIEDSNQSASLYTDVNFKMTETNDTQQSMEAHLIDKNS